MPQRQGKRQGLRTNATLRHNEFEHKANRGDFIIEKTSGVPFSLSKSKRWELLADENNQLPIRKMIPAHMESNSRSSPFWHVGFCGGRFVDSDRARQYQTVNGERSTIQLEQQEAIDEWIDLSFKDNEYPLKRELYKKHYTPCRACLNCGGVILFRGRGKKSSAKTKGMKSYHRKDWQDEFNL
ncbi:unnamed protein product [Rotaria socialis]|uniref:Uncharacterized protein n=1 Tax=Rotaria socialis TaxID=392032 RepID=A0A818NHB7_9BILA|nr:unnamed protein product [Rotaria socialis]CAF3326934.1 unnamed protein product [Rotaria socialis]CAF3518930.1 unnamed protein product [Rotaria socialis]CAF3606705.1 unnamed protein product [Rotaria socialis]CAF3661497.1 unnamed protein product [Rotaria socialis]